ncbi:MAG: LacI family transcriptional regulator, partial [Clostridium sp.]|nr:LacI family transcriptional regulator [Clostridium sp.]
EDRLVHRYRVEGIMDEARQWGAEIEVYESDKNYKSSFDRGYGQASELIRESLRPGGEPLPDGIIAASDATANGVIKACMEYGIAIPDQMSVIGFDDINGAVPAVELTSVSISHKLHVKRAINLLIRMKRERTLKEQERGIKLRPALVERSSCQAVRGSGIYKQ